MVDHAAILSSPVPLYAVLVSLLAVPLILASSNRPNLREFWTVLAAVVKFALVLVLLPGAIAGMSTEVRII